MNEAYIDKAYEESLLTTHEIAIGRDGGIVGKKKFRAAFITAMKKQREMCIAEYIRYASSFYGDTPKSTKFHYAGEIDAILNAEVKP